MTPEENGSRAIEDTEGGPVRSRPSRRGFIWGGLVALAAAAVAAVAALGRRALKALPPLPGLEAPYLGDFKVNTVEPDVPVFDPATWRLTVDGMVGRRLELTYQDLLDLPDVEPSHDFKCVEGWSVDDVRWEGVRVGELLRRAAPGAGATHVVFHASGGVYTDALTLAEARDPRALLAYRLNGAELDPRQGRPLRLIVPWMYGYKGPKWVERVELTDRPHSGYWEQRGYPVDATIRS